MGLKLLDVESFVPTRKIENSFFESYLDTSHEWIQKRTGIVSRYFSDQGLSLMIKEALKKMVIKEEWKEKIDLILTATISPDYIMPSVSAIVHGSLDLKEEVLCSDMNMACTGFVGALIFAEKFLEVGQCAICIGAEQLSSITDFHDRSTAMLFGDGVAVALVMKTEDKVSKIYGTQVSHDLSLKNGEGKKVEMDGKNIYKFATSICPKGIKKLLEIDGSQIESMDWIVLHQANSRIIDSVAKKVGGQEKFYQNIQEIGNTSSASIGLCLGEMKEKALLKQGNRLLLFAFGGGLTYAGIIVEWGKE